MIGAYECQVSTTPHISQLTFLQVKGCFSSFFRIVNSLNILLDPDTSILGGPQMFVDSLSMINLTCVISWTSFPPTHVVWYHNHTKLTFRGPRPGVSLIVDKSDVTTVSLLLQLARMRDSGVYSCKPDNAPEANITLHVLKGTNSSLVHIFISICRPPCSYGIVIASSRASFISLFFQEIKPRSSVAAPD